MLSLKNALRRPLVSLLGILLVASMTAFLCIGIGQAIVAKDTLVSFDDAFTTVALVSGKFRQDYSGRYTFGEQSFSVIQRTLPEEVSNWFDGVAKTYPDIIKAVASPGLASAYIPELEVDFHTAHPYAGSIVSVQGTAPYPRPYCMPYNCAVLEFELSGVGTAKQKESFLELVDETVALFETETTVQLKGKVTRVIGLHKGYSDPEGLDITITMKVRSAEALEALGLRKGEKYLVYTNSFIDRKWKSGEDVARFNIGDTFTYDENTYYLHSDGSITAVTDTTKTYTDENGETVSCTSEEYWERYSLPIIAHVPDGADAFLASEAGAEWREVLDNMKINEHAFPVIGVEKLDYLDHFARETALVIEGRDFSSAELKSGAKVCIISESLALKNGLSIGDTIDMNYYIYDMCIPYQDYVSRGKGVVEPSPYYYTSTTGMTDKETYKVIGFYRDSAEWSYIAGDLSAFSPNTIFVPQASVSGSMDYGDQGLFRTIILENGTVEEFVSIVRRSGYDGLYVCYDQGYPGVASSLFDYNEVAMRALVIGAAAAIILAILYFLLFPPQQRKNILIMQSVGTSRRKRISYLIGSDLCILLPGVLLGFLLSALSWHFVSRALLGNAEMEVYVDFEVGTPVLILTAALLLFCTFTIAVIIDLLMSRDRKMHQRK